MDDDTDNLEVLANALMTNRAIKVAITKRDLEAEAKAWLVSISYLGRIGVL